MNVKRCPLSDGQRQRMIARSAYLRCADRGFSGTDPVEDWLAAEKQIEKALHEHCSLQPAGKTISHYHSWGLLDTVTGRWQRFRSGTA